jgi:hypothetical protein
MAKTAVNPFSFDTAFLLLLILIVAYLLWKGIKDYKVPDNPYL